MPHNVLKGLFVAGLSVFVAASLFLGYKAYLKWKFRTDLNLVRCSTSLLGGPRAEKVSAAQQRAQDLEIDVLAAYRKDTRPGVRTNLAWLLISEESRGYYEFAKQKIESVSWCEVRVWVARRKDSSLSADYRALLLDLMLSSPSSEGRLHAGHWYSEQGRLEEAEDAYFDAMRNGLYWDSLDAAHKLMDSERYHADVVTHYLSIVRQMEVPSDLRAIGGLMYYYEAQDELQPLIDAWRDDPKNKTARAKLLKRLTELVETDLRSRVGNGNSSRRVNRSSSIREQDILYVSPAFRGIHAAIGLQSC